MIETISTAKKNYNRRDLTLPVALKECDLDKADNAIRPRLLSSKFASDCTRYEASTVRAFVERDRRHFWSSY